MIFLMRCRHDSPRQASVSYCPNPLLETRARAGQPVVPRGISMNNNTCVPVMATVALKSRRSPQASVRC